MKKQKWNRYSKLMSNLGAVFTLFAVVFTPLANMVPFVPAVQVAQAST